MGGRGSASGLSRVAPQYQSRSAEWLDGEYSRLSKAYQDAQTRAGALKSIVARGGASSGMKTKLRAAEKAAEKYSKEADAAYAAYQYKLKHPGRATPF